MRIRWITASGIFVVIFISDFILARAGYLQALDKWVRQVLYRDLDNSVPKWVVNTARTVSLVDVMAFNRDASFLVTVLVCGAIGCFLIYRGHIRSARLLLLVVLGAAFLASVLKDHLPITPPNELHRFGFPSGHAATSMAFGGFVILWLWPMTANRMARTGVAVAAALYISVVGVAVLENHYFSEIVAGYALAGAWVTLLVGSKAARLGLAK